MAAASSMESLQPGRCVQHLGQVHGKTITSPLGPSSASGIATQPSAARKKVQAQSTASIPGLLSALSNASSAPLKRSGGSRAEAGNQIPVYYPHLDGFVDPSPVQNPDENLPQVKKTLDKAQTPEQGCSKDNTKGTAHSDEADTSALATQLYTISYLILFAILGTLARLGLQAITFYPGAPVVFGQLWANFGGSLLFGFLGEDRKLFADECGMPEYRHDLDAVKSGKEDEEKGCSPDLPAARRARHNAVKKTIPLYIGLATGFCGSFTSFSSFIRDSFLALSNDLPTPLVHTNDSTIPISTPYSTVSRNGGYSFMALLAVVILTITSCVSALRIGADLAIMLQPFMPSLPYTFRRKFLDRLSVFLAWGFWLAAVLLAISPPDRNSDGPETWRGRAVFAIVFAPLGCLARFYTSLYLNGRILTFPIGTFVVNVVGTAVLGMSWDLQHVPLGGMVGCQVLQGVEDGFCGCLTTVSTWVGELGTLRRSHAYRYGAVSVLVSLCLMLVIMGGLRWTQGFSELQCIT